MKNWIICEHHGASLDRTKSNNGLPINAPINLDLVETFTKHEGMGIEFRFQNYKPITWNFMNEVARDMEYQRISELVRLGK